MQRSNRFAESIEVREIRSGGMVVAVEAFIPGNSSLKERMELKPNPISSNVVALQEAVKRQLLKRLNGL